MDPGPFLRSVDLFREQQRLEVFIEPGEAIVGNAGYLVSSVVDLLRAKEERLRFWTQLLIIFQVYLVSPIRPY
jgi:diaminopimelate decarboxylase